MNKTEIVQSISRYLTEIKWIYSYDSDKEAFRFVVNAKGKLKKLDYTISVFDDSYNVIVVCPLCADADDPKQMAAMAEFISRANYGLKNGNFEIDFRSGEIRYKTFVDLKDRELGSEVFENSIGIPSAMFNRYGVGILEILFGTETPESIINKIEGRRREV